MFDNSILDRLFTWSQDGGFSSKDIKNLSSSFIVYANWNTS